MILMRGSVIAAGLALSAVAPWASATNGYFSAGYGTKSEAIAGAGIGYSQDSLAVATNPAGLTFIDGGLDLGLTAFQPDRGASISQGGQTAQFSGNATKLFLMPAAGYAHHLNDQWTLGVAVYGNGGMNTDYASNPFARFGAQGTAGVDLSQAFLSPAVAWRINEQNSLAVAVNFAYQEFKAKGLSLFSGFSSSPTNLSDRGSDHSEGVGVHLGWQGQLTPALTLGATWQSKISTGEFKKYAGLFADHGGFDIPATFGVGLGYKASDVWHLALDWQRIQYSGVASVGNSVASLFAGVPLGASNGPGFGWHDASVVKLGTVVQATDRLTLRAGLSHNSQPVQASQTFFNVLAPGVVRDHLTVGASWKLADRDEISFSYLHALRNTVKGSGSIPPSFGGGEVNVHLAEDALGIGYSHKL
jgi:long-chain fatty acid transport protein